MKKLSIYMTALLGLALVGCDKGDYDPEVGPQSNDPEPVIAVGDITIESIPATINLADFIKNGEETSIPMGKVVLKNNFIPANTVIKPSVELATAADFSNSFIIEAEALDDTRIINLSPSKLQAAFVEKVTKDPNAKSMNVRIILKAVTNKDAVAVICDNNGNQFFNPSTVVITPEQPAVTYSSVYYAVVGTAAPAAMNHSEASVYDDPVFNLYISAAASGATEIAILAENDKTAYQGGDVTVLYGVAADKTAELSGKLVKGGNKISMPADAAVAGYDLVVNVETMSYEITVKKLAKSFYAVGAIQTNQWKTQGVECMFYGMGDDKYSYTTNWPNQWSLKIISGADLAPDNWNVLYGTTVDGCTDASGNLINSGANAFGPSNDGGLYTLTIDMKNFNYTWTSATAPAKTYNHISLIGVYGDWGTDIDLEELPNAPYNWYLRYTVTSDTELKFRANHEWNGDWGGDGSKTIDGSTYYMPAGSSNISVKAGTYDFYLNVITGQWNIKSVE